MSDPSRQLLLLSAIQPPALPFFPMGNRTGDGLGSKRPGLELALPILGHQIPTSDAG